VTDLFGTAAGAGSSARCCRWTSARPSPRCCAQLDFYGHELAEVERRLATEALDDPIVRRLMTIPGVDAMTAVTVLAAVGDFHRFTGADKLVSYLGLNPRCASPAGSPPTTGASQGWVRQGPRDAGTGRVRRAALPRPLRALHQRIMARRGMQIAIVAVARKIAASPGTW